VRRFADWFFASQPSRPPLWRVVVWWEARRIPFNVIVGLYGLVCLAVFVWAIRTSGHLQAGEDAVEPLALLAAPIGINIVYTLGWLVEVPSRLVLSNLTPDFGPLLLKTGLALGLLLITLPAVFWVGYRLLQVAGVIW
jgi:hypothetical protein